MVQHIRWDLVEYEIHASKFTQKFTLGSHNHETEIGTKFVPISYEYARLSTVSLSHSSQSLSLPILLTMSQQTSSHLASLQSCPDPAADTLAQYQALPVAHHQLEEATYVSGDWAASLDPSPEVIHIDLRSPTRNSYLGGKAWSTTLWRELPSQLPSPKFLYLTPQPAIIDQLLNSMRTNPVRKQKDARVQVYPTTNLVYTPPPPLQHGVPAGSCCRGTI